MHIIRVHQRIKDVEIIGIGTVFSNNHLTKSRPLWIMEHSQLQCHTLTQKDEVGLAWSLLTWLFRHCSRKRSYDIIWHHMTSYGIIWHHMHSYAPLHLPESKWQNGAIQELCKETLLQLIELVCHHVNCHILGFPHFPQIKVTRIQQLGCKAVSVAELKDARTTMTHWNPLLTQAAGANTMSLMDMVSSPRSWVAALPRASQNSKTCRVSKLPKSIKIAPPFRREFLSLPDSRLQVITGWFHDAVALHPLYRSFPWYNEITSNIQDSATPGGDA